MTVRDLLPMLPKYSDGSGYDVNIVYDDGKHSLFLCRNELLRPTKKPKQLDCEVVEILSGMLRSGGHFDDTLQLIVKEMN